MKNKTLVVLLVFLAGYVTAQQNIITASQADSMADAGNKAAKQRYVSSDIILGIKNINVEQQPIAILYYDNAETIHLAKELQSELQYAKMKVSSMTAYKAMTADENPKHYNFSYEVTDTAFVVKVYPQ